MIEHWPMGARIAIWAMIVAMLIYGVHRYERWRDYRAIRDTSPPLEFIWQVVRFGGGGSVYTPEPMTEIQAVAWAGTLGSVMHVDKDHHKIFYRPH